MAPSSAVLLGARMSGRPPCPLSGTAHAEAPSPRTLGRGLYGRQKRGMARAYGLPSPLTAHAEMPFIQNSSEPGNSSFLATAPVAMMSVSAVVSSPSSG